MEERVAALAEEYGLAVPPGAKVQDLSMGERQRTEILKLLHRDSRVLILDEPTAVLTPRETEQLFSALRRIASQGKAVVFISHKLQEVLDVADEIAILRNGHIVDEFGQGEHPTKAELANRMVGREVLLTLEAEGVFQEKVVLEIKHLSGHGLHDVDLAVRKGEIVAVAGVAGNGQKALVEVVTGLREPPEGEVRLLDTPWREFYARGRARKRWKGALGYIPEDRQGLATVRTLDMVDNVLLTTRQGFTKRMFLDRDKAEDATERLVQDFNVQPPLPQIRAYQLSGGNLQKLVLAREFFREPRIIVAEQPSQGLDVAATEEVWRQLLAARGRAGILLVTGDLNEAVQLADRIAVMFRGRIMDLFPASDKGKLDTIGLLMAGIHPDSGSDET
jgi:simple sugar transport system ATP-binding protein